MAGPSWANLDGKVALVTGAGTGIGRASALALSEAGARVALTELPDRMDRAEDTVAAIIAAGGTDARAIPLDVRDMASIRDCVAAATAFGGGRLDILLNNAGLNVPKMAFDVEEADWDAVLDVNLTRALCFEWAEYGIRVNAVGPTFVETPLTRPMFEDPEFRQDVFNRIPLGKLATPEDIAAAVVYLACPGAAMVSGHTLVVDGGWTAV
jgi:2-deoxy-D-gluconate 3-dehydrogenase